MTIVTTGNSPQQQKAAEVRERFTDDLDVLRSSPLFADLNDAARERRIAALYVTARDQLAALRKAEGEAQARRGREIESDLFGLKGADPALIISFRDAADRAARIEDNAAAVELLGLAGLSGDAVLAQAILGRALSAGWSDVVNQYATLHPERAALIQERVDRAEYAGSLTALAEGLGAEFVYQLSPPEEVAAWPASNAVQAAENGDPEAPPAAAPTTLADLIAPTGDPGGNRGANPADTFAWGTGAQL
jgi:hypothetical protein